MRPVLMSGPVAISPLETVQAIPYPTQHNAVVILENLAHADIFLHAPVFAKQLIVTVTFDPEDSSSIDAGVRTGVFWLGYTKQSLYKKGLDGAGVQTKTLTFPLTAMFEDTNQSIDFMLFTNAETAKWSVNDIHATVTPILPTVQETKTYIKSIWNRDREI